jgi:hypothetical protein
MMLSRRISRLAAAGIAAALGLQLAAALPAQASGVRPDDYDVSATMVLKFRIGEHVRISSPASVCTRNETTRTFDITTSPQTESFGFVAKTSGSCFFEESHADFDVIVTNDQGATVARQLLTMRSPAYRPTCLDYNVISVTCHTDSGNQVTLTQDGGPGSGEFVSAALSIYTGGPGPDIRIQGGGSGPDGSQCTTNETDVTVPAGPDPTDVPVGFDVKGSGSCITNPSYSYFTIKLQGTTASGRPATGTARIWLGQANPANPFRVECIATSPSVKCETNGARALTLRFNGSKSVADYRVTASLRFYVNGPGPVIKIEGGGGGTSNCTKDETSETVAAGADPTEVGISFIAKNNDGCKFDESYSYFTITISGRDKADKPVSGTARILLGQSTPGGSYTASCVSSSANVTCLRAADRELWLRLAPSSGGPPPGDYRVDATMVLNLVPGETASIVPTANNCTKDETSKTVKITADSQKETFGFEAKTGGSCDFESSWSNFRVRAYDGGKLAAEQLVGLSDPANSYAPYCYRDASWQMECRKTGNEVTLTQLVD